MADLLPLLLADAIVFGLIGLVYALAKGSRFANYLLLGLLLGPIGFLIALRLDERADDAQTRARHAAARAPCPMCREPVAKGAKICPHCRSPLVWPRQPKRRLVRREHSPA